MLLGFEIDADGLARQLASGDPPLLLDVRSLTEYAAGHIPGSRLVPLPNLRSKLDTLAEWKDRPVVVYCQSGQRSMDAMLLLKEAGFSSLKMLEGGYEAWARHQKGNHA